MDSALEELNKAIETKIQLLKFTHEQAEKAIEKGNITAIERQRKTLATKVEEVHDIQVKVQERRIEKGDNLEGIQGWNTKIEDSVAAYEKAVADLDKSVKEIRDKEVEAAKWREERVAAEIREKKFEEELRLEKAKLEQRFKYERKIEESRKGQVQTKLPKLVISKFKGTHTDWTRFWGQFEAEIEAAEVSKVTKFSYLKELLEPKVRSTIEGLPLTTEGYERAKNILKTRYGKASEIVDAYMSPTSWSSKQSTELIRTKLACFMKSCCQTYRPWRPWVSSEKSMVT